MAKIIIIDGPRGSGKSTTSAAIVTALVTLGIETTYFKKGLRADDELKNMIDHLEMFKRMSEHVVVVDRFAATEFVMSTAHDRVQMDTLMRWMHNIDSRIKDCGALHYILLPSIATLTNRLAQREREGVSRTWDMRAELVHPLWRVAGSLLASSTTITNETLKERESLIEIVKRNILVKDFTR